MNMNTGTNQATSRTKRGLWLFTGVGLLAVTAIVFLSFSKVETAQTQADPAIRPAASSTTASSTTASSTAASTSSTLLGGPRGVVKDSKGTPVEGLMVQLISNSSSIRTTVYSNYLGQYEFPKLKTDDYTLRIARPLEFRPYMRESVRIEGATALDDIVVEPVVDNLLPPNSTFLPADKDILSQLSGSELAFNLPGSHQERQLLINSCGNACHGVNYLFRVRFDEDNWRKLTDRMLHYNFRIMLMPPREPGFKDHEEIIINWLARYRGLDGPEMPPVKPFPRPQGPATRVVVTEYEMPFAISDNLHDVTGDPEGNIWFTPNKTSFIGKLVPNTGEVTLYRTPKVPEAERRYMTEDPPGVYPGTHWIDFDENTGIVWFSDTWAGSLGRLDPRTGDIQWVYTGMQGNVTLAADGKTIWRTDEHKIKKFDTSTVMQTGQPVKEYELKNVSHTYGNFLSKDGRYFGGGGNDVVWLDTHTGEVREKVDTVIGSSVKGRGDFDQDGNMWMGTLRGLMKYDPKHDIVSYYSAPTPYATYYVASVDKNGDVWAGQLQGGRVNRYRPSTQQWTEYVLPTPWSFENSSWIDDSTTPPTYWYGDNYGYIVSVQPLE